MKNFRSGEIPAAIDWAVDQPYCWRTLLLLKKTENPKRGAIIMEINYFLVEPIAWNLGWLTTISLDKSYEHVVAVCRNQNTFGLLYTSRWIRGYATLGQTNDHWRTHRMALTNPYNTEWNLTLFFVTQTNSKPTCLLVSVGNGIHSENLHSNKIVGRKNWKNTGEEPESARKASGLENNDKPCRNLLSRPLSNVHHNQSVNLGITLHGSRLKKKLGERNWCQTLENSNVFFVENLHGCATRTSTEPSCYVPIETEIAWLGLGRTKNAIFSTMPTTLQEMWHAATIGISSRHRVTLETLVNWIVKFDQHGWP